MSKFLRLTRGTPGKLDGRGLEPLRLALWKDGREVAHLVAYSGAPGAQNFRTLSREVRGELEPIPEARYRSLGGLDFAGGPGDWETAHLEILSPLWITIYAARAIGFHLDGNLATSPGSAGCVVVLTIADLKTLASWWDGTAPAYLDVDWGLGTVSKPVLAEPIKPGVSGKPAPARHRVLAWAHPGGSRVRFPAGFGPGDYSMAYLGGDGGAAAFVFEVL